MGHLYLYDSVTGMLKNPITQGEWLVRDLVHVDEGRRIVYFLAGGMEADSDRARRRLCAVNLDGSGLKVLATHDGDVFVPVSEAVGLEQGHPYRPFYAQPGVSPDGRFAIA